MTKRDDQDFEDLDECWIGDNAYVDGDVNVGYHWHITGKCRGYVHGGKS